MNTLDNGCKAMAGATVPIVALLAASAVAKVVEEPSGYELWGMRKRHVAIVNPVLGEDPKWTMSLDGEWEFKAEEYRARRNSLFCRFQEKTDWGQTRQMRVPGLVETQGVGEPGLSRPWDCFWDASPKPLKHVFKGAAWYRRTFTIPAEWAGRRIWLKVGNVAAQGWFWVNGSQVAWCESYCGTYKYEITDLVTPGKETFFVVEVSNEVASRTGTRSSMNRWCGIPRSLELEATPGAFIDDAWVRGDYDACSAEAHVEVDGLDAVRSMKVRVAVDGETAETDAVAGDETVVRLPLKDFRPWSPESPNLYTARVELVENGVVVQTRRERFGVRKFEVCGKDFYLNDRPFFIRGIGYHNIQPVHGNDKIGDREYRRAEVRKMREAGFNFLRTHTRCETPEFFEVCDELGMMVQPEMPYYTDLPCEKFEFNPVRDAKELFVHMRRHPSFAVYSHGNEGSFGPALGRHMYQLIKGMDKDRLVIDQDNAGDEWMAFHYGARGESDFVGGPIAEWKRGSCQSDRPIVCHEYLNLTVKANAELEDRYTGIWQVPYGRAKRCAWLAKSGLTDFWGVRLQRAQHALQAYWLKHGIESARADPWCDGYSYWSAQDCTSPQGESYTAQGLFDPFWGEKPGGHSAASVAVFNGPSCLLCDGGDDSAVFVSGETMVRSVLFAHYGDKPMSNASLEWALRAADGKVLVAGEKEIGDVALGAVRKIADVSFAVPTLDSACRASFEVRLGAVFNAWDVWLFPRREPRDAAGVGIAAPFFDRLAGRYTNLSPVDVASVVVAPLGSAEAAAARQRGASLVEIGPADGESEVKLGWWWIGKQVGTVFADHPMLKYLPHSGHLDPLFFRILKAGMPLPVDGFSEKDLVVVSEGPEKCAVHLAERHVDSRREYLIHGLDVLSDLPESIALLDGIIDDAVGNSKNKKRE